MEDETIEGEVLELDESQFNCLVCDELLEFDFDTDGPIEPESDGELPKEFKENIATPENFTDEVDSGMDENTEETMRIDCVCGAEYLIRKIPGVPGFEVIHMIESEPELAEKEFEQEFEI